MQDIQVKVCLNPPLSLTPCVGLSKKHNLSLGCLADQPLDRIFTMNVELRIHVPVHLNNKRLQFISHILLLNVRTQL